MIIITDTREASPLDFTADYIEMVVRDKLDFGDYSSHYNGDECPVFFERKSHGDLFSTLGGGHDRFREEINRSVQSGKRLVVMVEVSLTKVLGGYSHSKMSGCAVARTLFTLMIKHGVPFVCCTSRDEMANYIGEFYYSWWKNRGKV